MSQNIPLPFNINGGVSLQTPQNAPLQPTPSVPQAQNMAFQQNAQLPGVDMSALLQGISPQQLALIGQLFQTGQLQLPPQPPQPPTAAVSTLTASTSNAANGTHAPFSSNPGLAHEDSMDVDKEEGEWEEEEPSGHAQRNFLRSPPRGPRQRSSTPRDRRRRRSREPVNAQSLKASGSPPRSAAQLAMQRKSKRDSAKAFVLALHRAGFTFEDLAQEVGDSRMLGLIYHELGLDSSSRRQNNHSNATPLGPAALNGNANEQASPLPTAAGTVNGTSSRPVLASPGTNASSNDRQPPQPVRPTPGIDRSAYLAKLKAAKNKTANTPATDSQAAVPTVVTAAPPQFSSSTLALSAASTSIAPAGPSANGVTPAQQPRKAKVQTDLVRQRLAALKEEQARRHEAERSSVSSTARPAPVNQSASAQYDAIAQAVQAQAPNLSTQQVNNAVAVIATLPPQTSSPQPDLSLQPTPSDGRSQPPQSPNTNAPLQSSIPGTPFFGLPGLFTSGSPFEARRTVQLPGLAPPSATPPLALEPVLARSTIAKPPTPARSESPNLSLTSSEASSRVNSVLDSPVTAEAEQMQTGPAAQKRAAVESSNPPAKRRFGQAVLDHVIIDNSDDEQDLEDDRVSELDQTDDSGNATPFQPMASGVAQTTNGVNHPGSLRNFPSSVLPGLSSASMPVGSGATTPGGTPYERKMLEIREMNRRIQELKARKARASGLNTPTARDAVVDDSTELLTTADATDSPAAVISAPMSSGVGSPVAQSTPKTATAVAVDHDAGIALDTTLQMKESGLKTIDNDDDDDAAAAEADNAAQELDDAMDMSTEEESEADDSAPQQQNLQLQQSGQGSVESSDASSDDDSDDEGSVPAIEADRENDTATVDPAAQPTELAVEEDDLDDESSAAFSTESEDEYEPEPAHADDIAYRDLASNAPPNPTPVQATSLPGLCSLPRAPTAVSMQDAQLVNGPQDVDLAPELQPDVAHEGEQGEELTDAKAPTRYTPYQSPLMIFKGYRYHPEYTSTVPGGFKSLTYNHKINPELSFCPDETSEAGCRDPSCDNQHFRDVGVTDNDLLRELGTNNIPASTPEANQLWREGLGNVVKQLRATNLGKDVNAIAARIAQFRREFIGSPDKVLNLGV